MSTDRSKWMVPTIGSSIRRMLAAFGLAAILVAPESSAAQDIAALPATALSAATGAAARPISAWTEFCRRYPAECAIDGEEPATIALTPSVWQTINTINRRVNKALGAMTDLDHWNAADRWDLGEDGHGDCEDFQLRKRQMLAEAGLPRRAMRMTVVIDDKGEGHAVLTILTNRGDLILDNKISPVLPWAQTGYTFIKRESQDVLGWVALGRAPSPTTTANR